MAAIALMRKENDRDDIVEGSMLVQQMLQECYRVLQAMRMLEER